MGMTNTTNGNTTLTATAKRLAYMESRFEAIGKGPRFTSKRVANGEFETFFDGVKTPFTIHNGCIGLSGKGNNLYGISNSETGKINWLGSLQACKKLIAHTMEKRSRKN
jgi:hypothetical protein